MTSFISARVESLSPLEFIAERDGALFLGVNEGNLNDNSGAFEVKVEIDPQGE